MKKLIYLLLLAMMPIAAAAYKLQRVSVHDPSVVWEPESQTYYIFGSHRDAAYSTDLMSWTKMKAPWKTAASSNASNSAAFKTNQTKTITIGGQEVAFGNFDAYAWSAAIAKNGNDTWNIDGNMWAPDVIYNKAMGKWCMYLSINGFKWNSSIILLTADQINGPYMYQGPVIFSGFNVTSEAGTSYKTWNSPSANRPACRPDTMWAATGVSAGRTVSTPAFSTTRKDGYGCRTAHGAAASG